MNLWMVFRISLRALMRNKLRTFLTALGIIIGVSTVITMLAIGTGAQRSVEATIASLGTNTIMIFPGSSTSGGARSGAFGASNLTERLPQASWKLKNPLAKIRYSQVTVGPPPTALFAGVRVVRIGHNEAPFWAG